MKNKVVLKPGKEKPILNNHQWIFSGAVELIHCENPGDLIQVFSNQGDLLGWGYFNSRCSLIGRMVCFGNADPLKAIEENLIQSINLRKKVFSSNNKTLSTNAYRLVNGEGDSLPGLIIDRYNSALVLQIGTLGMDKLREFILEKVKEILPECPTIYEKSSSQSREEEGLEKKEGLIAGEDIGEIEVCENGIKFVLNILLAQKTGLYLDHREMRFLLGSIAKDQKILNCFSYTGGFSAYGARNNARQIDTIDSSATAISYAQKNFEKNNFIGNFNFYCCDAFDFLKRSNLSDYDIIIIDPPALAKKKNQVDKAKEKYQSLNRDTLKKMKKNSILFTSSCSYYIDSFLFKNIITSAARQAGRKIKIISNHRQALDHPINPFHPETEYLKGYVIEVI